MCTVFEKRNSHGSIRLVKRRDLQGISLYSISQHYTPNKPTRSYTSYMHFCQSFMPVKTTTQKLFLTCIKAPLLSHKQHSRSFLLALTNKITSKQQNYQ